MHTWLYYCVFYCRDHEKISIVFYLIKAHCPLLNFFLRKNKSLLIKDVETYDIWSLATMLALTIL